MFKIKIKSSVITILILITVLICPGFKVAATGYTGWSQQNGTWYYFDNGSKVMNSWRLDSIGWCYLGTDGSWTKTGWVKDSNGWCYIGANGYWDGNPAVAKVNCFPLLSNVQMPESINYTTFQKDANNGVSYYYAGDSVNDGFIAGYQVLLINNGWRYYNGGTYPSGNPYKAYYKGSDMILLITVKEAAGNVLIVTGTIH